MSFQGEAVKSNENISELVTADTTVRRKVYRAYDYGLLILTVFMVAIGLVFLYSTSSYTSTQKFGYATFYLKRQASYAVIGVIAMLVVSFIDYKVYIDKLSILKIRPIYGLYLICIGLQIAVLIFGEDIYGAKRWLDIPKIGSFQPSEVTKICVIIFTAFIAYASPKRLNRPTGFFRVLLYLSVPILLVGKEDLSTAIVLMGIVFIICFVTSKKWWYFILAGVLAGGAAAAYIFFGDSFRSSRIKGWLDVDSAYGYQIRRSLYAISSGGLTGKGLGESSMKLGYVPESHNDMIFSIICEELGIIGGIILIALVALLLWRMKKIFDSAADLYGKVVVAGVAAHIAIQTFLNIAVVTNLLPNTGVPLPFISYGGTAVIFLLIEIGLVLSVSRVHAPTVEEKRMSYYEQDREREASYYQ